MRPRARIVLTLAVALLVGGVLALLYAPLVSVLQHQRAGCLLGSSSSSAWCGLVVRYPHRFPAVVLALVAVGLVALGVLAARWCLRPFAELVGVVDRMGPANLGYRLRPGRRRDAYGRLAQGLDAMMDRIAAGYDSQRRFAANASHELRTPLALQRTLIEVGFDDADLTPDQLSLLTTQLLAANRRNERLIEGLLVLAEAEQVPVGHTPQPLDEIAAAVVDLYAERATSLGIALRCHGEPCSVGGERVLLERLVTNLVENALAYNLPADGQVDVNVHAGVLSVVNTGPVIAAEEVDALFDAFRRGTGERLRSSGGAGLGLTICRAVAAVHHADISARPGPSGGLSVRVEFPHR